MQLIVHTFYMVCMVLCSYRQKITPVIAFLLTLWDESGQTDECSCHRNLAQELKRMTHLHGVARLGSVHDSHLLSNISGSTLLSCFFLKWNSSASCFLKQTVRTCLTYFFMHRGCFQRYIMWFFSSKKSFQSQIHTHYVTYKIYTYIHE